MASEYGWSKKEILEQTYFDEYIEYAFAIKKRLFSHYQILLAISTNPHVEEQSRLWEVFQKEDITGMEEYKLNENAMLDKSGFEQLKLAMADNPRIIIK